MSVTGYSESSFQSRPPANLLFLPKRFPCVNCSFRPATPLLKSAASVVGFLQWSLVKGQATKANDDTNE